MIRGYAGTPSLLAGSRLDLHVSTTSPYWTYHVYRQGSTLIPMALPKTPVYAGLDFPCGPPDVDWGWPHVGIEIPGDWPSGAYIIVLEELSAADAPSTRPCPRPELEYGHVLFVIRATAPETTGRILYKLPWATYQAYNGTNYGSLYAEAVWRREYSQEGYKITTRRAGCGMGGNVMPGDGPDAHDRSSRRQTFWHWDAPLIAWLETEMPGRCDYVTDWDMHFSDCSLSDYALMISPGHDEYWSTEIRSRIESFISSGGNVAFFSGNICGWRIHFRKMADISGARSNQLPRGVHRSMTNGVCLTPKTALPA